MREKFTSARLKIERAKEHVADMESGLQRFHALNPYHVGVKRDPNTRRPTYFMLSVAPVPRRISLLVGETIHCLRSALDHIAYELFIANGGTPTAAKHVYFPISDSAAKYKTEGLGKVKGLAQTAINAINATEPYDGGNGRWLWVLHKLNNIDKHRLLIVVVSAHRNVDVSAIFAREFAKLPSGRFKGLQIPPIPLMPADRKCPLKSGDELFTDAPDAEFDQNIKFTFTVSFGEPGILEGEPVVESLHQMTNLVSSILTRLLPFV